MKRDLGTREIWNDCIGVLLVIAGLVGLYFQVPHAGWAIFLGAMFFLAP